MKDTTALLPYVRLHLNIHHPSVEECYTDGYEFAKLGLEETENPYKEGSAEANHWSEGWWDGFYEQDSFFGVESAAMVEEAELQEQDAPNDENLFSTKMNSMLLRFLEVGSALAVSAAVGYQLLDFVA